MGCIRSTKGWAMSGQATPVLQPRRIGRQPLLGETIGENLRRIAAAHPSARRWWTCRPAAAGPTRQLDADTDTLARGLIAAGIGRGDRVGIWAPNCAEWVLLQYATAKIGVDPGQHQPGLPQPRARLRAAPVRRAAAGQRRGFKTSDYRAMVEEVRGDLPGLEQVIYLGTADWDALLRGGRRAGRPAAADALAEREADAGLRRPDQHPVHERHDRVPQGRDAVAPQHPEQRLLRRRGLPATRRRTGSASRCRSTTASAWCWATWPAPRTAPAS